MASVTEANNLPITDAAPMPVKGILGGLPISPANPLPVAIENVTITVGELNVLLSAYGSPYDSVRISDGTNELAVSAAGSIGVDLRVFGAPVTGANPVPITGSVTISGSVGQADESSFVEGVNSVMPIAGVRIDVPIGDVPDNKAAAPRITPKRALHVNLRDSAAAEFGILANPFWSKITDGTDFVGISTVGGAKALKVDVIQSVGGGGTGTSMADEAAFTEGTTQFTPIGGEFKDAGIALTDGQAGAARLTSKRALHVNLRDATGAERGTAGSPLRVDPTGTTPQPASQSGAWTVAANQGTAAAIGSAWPIKVTDGANPAAVKNADPVSTDYGLVTRNMPQRSGTATTTNVVSSAVSVTLLAANSARLTAIINNDSTKTLFVKFGTGASATSNTREMGPHEQYEVPGEYTGRIDGIWSAANGAARVTEIA